MPKLSLKTSSKILNPISSFKIKPLHYAVLLVAASLAGQNITAYAAEEIEHDSGAPVTLSDVTVSSSTDKETATGPINGYIAKQNITASKTDTPIAETPQSISVITRERLDAQGVADLGQALRYTPGVQGEPFGVEPRFTFLRIRGFDASTTGLFRDGLKLSNPGFAISYGLEPYGSERIEVLRGPASVLYGQASPGGLVNYVTKRPSENMINEIGVQLGSFDRKQTTLDVGGNIDDEGTLSYRLTGLVRDSQTQLDRVNDDRVYIAPSLTWKINDDTNITFLTHYQKDDTRSSQALPANGTLFGNPNGNIDLDTFTGEPNVDRYEREEFALGYLFEHRFNDNLTFRQNTRYLKTDLDDISVFSLSVNPDQRTVNRGYYKNLGKLASFTIDNQLQYTFGTGPVAHTLLGGYDYQHIDLDSLQAFGGAPSLDIFNPVYGAPVADVAPFRDDNTTQMQSGVYLQDQIKYNQWNFSMAGRYDAAETITKNRLSNARTKQTDYEFTGKLGALYQFDNGISPYFSYSESFLPALGTDLNGQAFKPENANQYEVGVKYQPVGQRSFIGLGVFELTREDFLQTNPATFAQEQRGEAKSTGLELEGLASINQNLDLIFNYTIMDVEVTKTNDLTEKGQRPSQTPAQLASIWADYHFKGGILHGLSTSLGVRYIGSSYGDAQNTLKVPAVTLFDAAIRYDWENARLALNAQNLLDIEYIGSAFVRGVDAFAVAGQARTVNATLTYRW